MPVKKVTFEDVISLLNEANKLGKDVDTASDWWRDGLGRPWLTFPIWLQTSDGKTFDLWDDDRESLDDVNYNSSLQDIHKYLEGLIKDMKSAPKPLDFKINNEEVTINSDGITVGCTTVDFEIFDKLTKAVQAFKRKK
jgi:hypothetical protein